MLSLLKYLPNVNKSWKILKSIWFSFKECEAQPDTCCGSTACVLKQGNTCDSGDCCERCQVRRLTISLLPTSVKLSFFIIFMYSLSALSNLIYLTSSV